MRQQIRNSFPSSAALISCSNISTFDCKELGRTGKGQSLSRWHFKENHKSRIVSLFQWGCPATILLRIRTIYIYSINRCAFRRFFHIMQKCFKRIDPFSTHFYASKTIDSILWICFAVTARFGFGPGTISFGSDTHRECMFFSTQTPAAFSITTDKRAIINGSYFSAITVAFPKALRLSSFRPFHNSEFCKTTTN